MATRIRSYRSFGVDEHLQAVAAERDRTMIVTGKIREWVNLILLN